METDHNCSPALRRRFVLYGFSGEITEMFGTVSRTKCMYCTLSKSTFFPYAYLTPLGLFFVEKLITGWSKTVPIS